MPVSIFSHGIEAAGLTSITPIAAPRNYLRIFFTFDNVRYQPDGFSSSVVVIQKIITGAALRHKVDIMS